MANRVAQREPKRSEPTAMAGEAEGARFSLPDGARRYYGIEDAARAGTRGPGGPLPFLAEIQRSFGAHDVSDVQAHTDGHAAAGARAMGAEAFASGRKVAFAGAPALHTAAHEAAHVVQQRAGVHLKGGVGEEGDRHEQHADRVADLVVAGQSAEAALNEYAGSGGGEAIQRKITADMGPYVLQTYDAELQSTGAKQGIAAVADGLPYVEEICTTDRANDCESGNKIIVPHIAEAIAAEDNEEAGQRFFTDDTMRNNGLTVEENCRHIAEHEFVHFRYMWDKQDQFSNLGNAKPPNWDQIGENVLQQMRTLLDSVKEAWREAEEGGEYEAACDFLKERIEYVFDPGQRGSSAAEAPAVAHEMGLYIAKLRAKLETRQSQSHEGLDDDASNCLAKLVEWSVSVALIAAKFAR